MQPPTFSPLSALGKAPGAEGFQELNDNPAVYYAEYSDGEYTLWKGPGPKLAPNPGKVVLRSTTEGRLAHWQAGLGHVC